MSTSLALRVLPLLAATLLLGAPRPSSADAPKAQLKYLSARDLAARVAAKTDGLSAQEVAADPSATTLIIRRDQTGEVEVHTLLNDILVVESGRATMLVGGEVKGGHEIKPSEWRGGEITGGERHELAAGDLLLIPAGVPHQCLLKHGESVVYLTIKTPTAVAAAPR